MIARLRSRINGLTVSTDLILGFPGETEALFEDTMETLKRLNFSHIHAFPYSPRKGTPAATMEGQIDTAEKKRRVELVNELSARQKAALLESLVGTNALVLVETQEGTDGEGFTGNYERVALSGLSEGARGTVVSVALVGTDGKKLLGKAL